MLARINAQLAPIEQAFTRAGVPYQVRGQRFYERRDVRDAIGLVRRGSLAEHGAALIDCRPRPLGRRSSGTGTRRSLDGAEARERAAALDTLLAIGDDLVAPAPT